MWRILKKGIPFRDAFLVLRIREIFQLAQIVKKAI